MHTIIIDCIVQSRMRREADITVRLGVHALGCRVCLQVPLQRVNGAVGANTVEQIISVIAACRGGGLADGCAAAASMTTRERRSWIITPLL